MLLLQRQVPLVLLVSIQLISLASRDLDLILQIDCLMSVSIQLISLASRDRNLKLLIGWILSSFHSINIPSE